MIMCYNVPIVQMKILLLYIAELFSLAFEGSDGDKISKSLNLVFFQ